MHFTVIIPARHASSRLPGKPLLPLAGKPLLQHVWERSCQSQAAEVIIATDDVRIESAARAFGARVCMTSERHPSGTDRLQEVCQQLQLDEGALVVNVQGDEPLVPPELINQVAQNLAACPQASIATLSEPLYTPEELFNPNIVKLVTDRQGMALYFSRSPLPWAREHFSPLQLPQSLPQGMDYQRHLGLYAYRVGFLNQYVGWPPAPLEEAERLEQLRALWQGHRIHVARAVVPHPQGVDTPEDYQRLCRLFPVTDE